MKKNWIGIAVICLLFLLSACSTNKDAPTNEANKKENNSSALTDQVKSKMYNAARIAEGKVADVFAHDMAADEKTPILNQSFANESAAVSFLSKYFSETMAKELFAYYATGEQTADKQVIVKEEPFLPTSLLDTTLSDVTIEGDAKKATIVTPEKVTYTMEETNGQYLVTKIQK